MEASDTGQNDPQEPQDGETDPAARTEEQEADAPEPTQGDQGPQVIEQDAADAGPSATGRFDPNQPNRISPPTPDQQSGVPGIPENEGVGAGEDSREESVTAESEGGSAGGDQG